MATEKNKQGAIVGMFIFFGLLILLAGLFMLGGQKKNFQKTITLNATFADVGGLLKGNNIWFAGIKIGTVKDIEITDNGLARVEMRIDKTADRFVSKDAKVKLGLDGLIGNRILVIYDGTDNPNRMPVQDGDTLQTMIPVNSTEMMNTLQENNKNLYDITSDIKVVSHRLAEGQGTLGKLLTNDSMAMQLQASLAILQRASENVQLLTSNVAAYTKRLQTKGALANELVTDTTLFRTLKSAAAEIKQASANAQALTENLNQVSYNLKDSSNVAGVLLHDQQAGGDMRAAIANIQSGSEKFNEDMEALRHNFLFRGFFKKRGKKENKDKVDRLSSR